MKVLYVISNLENGGAQKLIVDLLLLLREMGCKCDVLAFKKTKNDFYEKQLTDAGINVYYSDVNKYYSLKNIETIKGIRSNYDLIHSHLFHAQYYVAIDKILSQHDVPLITTEHSTYNKRRKRLFKLMEKIIYSKYELCIAISEGVKQSLFTWLGKHTVNIPVVFNGVNIDEYKSILVDNENNSLSKKEKIVLCMTGRLVSSKNHKLIIDALECLPPKYIVNFVGDGDKRTELESYVYQKQLSKRVNFLGYQEDVKHVLKDTDIYIQSSNWEGFGLAVVEAMAMGLPILASNVPGLSEIVKGVGYTFESNNPEELAKLILKVENTEGLFESLRLKSIKSSREYDIKRTAEKYLNLYKEIT